MFLLWLACTQVPTNLNYPIINEWFDVYELSIDNQQLKALSELYGEFCFSLQDTQEFIIKTDKVIFVDIWSWDQDKFLIGDSWTFSLYSKDSILWHMDLKYLTSTDTLDGEYCSWLEPIKDTCTISEYLDGYC